MCSIKSKAVAIIATSNSYMKGKKFKGDTLDLKSQYLVDIKTKVGCFFFRKGYLNGRKNVQVDSFHAFSLLMQIYISKLHLHFYH